MLQLLPDTLGERLGKYEVVEFLVVGGEHVLAAAAPGEVPFVDEGDGFADDDDGVEVVGVNDGGDAELVGDVGQQLVDGEGSFGVKAGVGLVTEQIARIAGDGARNGGALLHTAAQLAWVQLVDLGQFHALQTEVHPLVFLLVAHTGEHIQREAHILFDGHRVEQRGALEHHSHLGAQLALVGVGEAVEVAIVIEHLALFGGEEPHQTLHHHRLAGSRPPDDEVYLALFKLGVDVVKDLLLPKIFRYILEFYHFTTLFG